jgi:hypothetical protein
MKKLPLSLLTLYADLLQQMQSMAVAPASVRTQRVKGTEYLKANTTVGAFRRTIYLGPAGDPIAQQRAQAIKEEMERAKTRRKTITLLRNAGVPAPNTELGRVLEVLAAAHLFAQGLVLVGTAAYQCYSPLVGAALPAAALTTRDADLATPTLALSARYDAFEKEPAQPSAGPNLETILRQADPTFRAIPGLNRKALPSHFKAASGFLVDLLVPARRRSDANPMPIPALQAGGALVQYLDWLIDTPSPVVALYGAGVLVQVPRPARYAVHKLILAQENARSVAKRQKDLLQARSLFEILQETDPYAIEDALEDARSQGRRGWRRPIERSLHELGLTGPA